MLQQQQQQQLGMPHVPQSAADTAKAQRARRQVVNRRREEERRANPRSGLAGKSRVGPSQQQQQQQEMPPPVSGVPVFPGNTGAVVQLPNGQVVHGAQIVQGPDGTQFVQLPQGFLPLMQQAPPPLQGQPAQQQARQGQGQRRPRQKQPKQQQQQQLTPAESALLHEASAKLQGASRDPSAVTHAAATEEQQLMDLQTVVSRLDVPSRKNIRDSLYRMAKRAGDKGEAGGSAAPAGYARGGEQPPAQSEQASALQDANVADLLYAQYKKDAQLAARGAAQAAAMPASQAAPIKEEPAAAGAEPAPPQLAEP